MSINSVTISGNLTRDAELRTTQGGTAIMALSVAVNERRRDASGEWGDYANYFDCTMFGARAEKLAQYLTKGTKVAIEGKLSQQRWQDGQTGQNRSKVGIIVDNIEFMSRKGAQNGGYGHGGGQGGYDSQPERQSQQSANQSAYAQDYIPF